MAVTSVAGMARSIYTMAYLLPQVIDMPAPPMTWSMELTRYVNFPGYLAGFIGISLPMLEGAQRWATPRWTLRTLTPLWEDITSAFPRLVRASSDLPEVELRLRDMVIHEGLLWLREYSSPQALADARAWASAAGTEAADAPSREAAAIARWAITTLPRVTAQPRHQMATWALSPLAAEPDWLVDVAREYTRLRRRPRLVQEVASWPQNSATAPQPCPTPPADTPRPPHTAG
ncbi:DUF6545 domain-containing protein [Nonomuraea sp. NPDC049709]|uniref:DUF6545 domain-containing protein n=1 Tax=Nonomuraea sp. NPDC049709 TaxID=3154736 RepID=UPI003447D2C9